MVGYSAISSQAGSNASIRFGVLVDGDPAERGFGTVSKAATKTGDTIAKQATISQKAMDKLTKSMEGAGGAAYDFGSQAFQSMTVLDAIKEGSTGFLEQVMMSLFDPNSVVGDVATMLFGHFPSFITKKVMEVDWAKLGDDIGEALGTHSHDVVYEKISKSAATGIVYGIDGVDYVGQLKMAMGFEDWTTVGELVATKIASGDFSAMDVALREAIEAGDYAAAGGIITAKLAGVDYSDIGKSIIDDIGVAFGLAEEAVKKLQVGMETPMLPAEVLSQYARMSEQEFEDLITKFHDTYNVWSEDEVTNLRAWYNMQEMQREMEKELQTTATNFGSYLKNPDIYSGLGVVLYNLVKSEIDDK